MIISFDVLCILTKIKGKGITERSKKKNIKKQNSLVVFVVWGFQVGKLIQFNRLDLKIELANDI